MKRGEIFNHVVQKQPNSNSFDLSHDHKTTTVMGRLTPVLIKECIPGDKWNINASCLIRLAPLLAPVMHKAKVDIHFFFVANRTVWENWPTFIAGDDPFGTPPAFPFITVATGYSPSTLGAYLGLPIFPGNSIDGDISVIPFACYQFIYNDYYRDENLITPIDFQLADGDNAGNAVTLQTIRFRAWMHDYFTSALPWAQKGDPISLPIAGFNDVNVYIDTTTNFAGKWIKTDNTNMDAAGVLNSEQGLPMGNAYVDQIGADAYVRYNPNGTLKADTSTLTTQAVTINDLRRAEALQVWLEANARGGTRYTESIQTHFNVKSPDARLQRPEFIGGISNPIVFSEVLQTSETDTTPQGTMAGHGISAGRGGVRSYFCQEHGYIMGIMSIMPVTGYSQGLERHWFKFDKFQFAWPELANLGEQEILNKEIYASDDNLNEEVFGYTPRYAEYKYAFDRISGEFADDLDFWTMSRLFSARPVLNSTFITANPTDRIFAVQDGSDNLWCHVMFDINCRRLLPRYGIPSIT